MPTGFKGAHVELREIVITSSELKFHVKFVDDDGLTHAVTSHSMTHEEAPKAISGAVKRLLAQLQAWTETVHFDSGPSSGPQETAAHGIAEALGRKPTTDTGLSGAGGITQDGE